MSAMTARQKRKYFSSKGTICPACQSKDIRMDLPKTLDNEVRNTIHCNACNETWIDTYRLIDVRFEHEDVETEPKVTPLKKETPVIFYFRFHRKYDERKGGLTVVFNPVTRRFGVSRCNTGSIQQALRPDPFKKIEGRELALSRTVSDTVPPWHPTMTVLDEDMTMERIREMAENIAWRLRYYCCSTSMTACLLVNPMRRGINGVSQLAETEGKG